MSDLLIEVAEHNLRCYAGLSYYEAHEIVKVLYLNAPRCVRMLAETYIGKPGMLDRDKKEPSEHCHYSSREVVSET